VRATTTSLATVGCRSARRRGTHSRSSIASGHVRRTSAPGAAR
jgi:hypothetical protein